MMWVTIALDRETRVAIDLDRFEDGGGAPAEGRISKFRRGRAIGKQRPASGRPYYGSTILMLACVVL